METADSLRASSGTDTLVIASLIDPHGCTASDTVVVHTLPLPVINLPDTVAGCPGDSIGFEVPYGAVQWQTGSQSVHGRVFRDVYSTPATLSVSVTDASHCTAHRHITLLSLPQPLVALPADTTVCMNEPVALHYPAIPGEGVTWHDPYGKAHASPWKFATDTPLRVFAEVTNAFGCTSADSMLVRVFGKPEVQLEEVIHVCEHHPVWTGDVVSGAVDNPAWRYQWQPAEWFEDATALHSHFTPAADNSIRLLVHHETCRADTFEATVRVHAAPHITTCTDTTIGAERQATLYALANEPCAFTWYPDVYISSSATANPVVYPPIHTTYYVQAENQHGCTSRDSVTVFVDNDLFIPGLFSPNGDGNNDVFKLYGSGFSYLELHIYSLSGKLVWESASPVDLCERGWDGTEDGSPLPQGTYIWKIKGVFTNGDEMLYKGKNTGMVQLIR